MNRFSITALLMVLSLAAPCPAAEPANDLRVMSFNIRYETANDGENHWEWRREFLVQTIQAFDPDLLGTQETVGFQRDYLAQQFPVTAVLRASSTRTSPGN